MNTRDTILLALAIFFLISTIVGFSDSVFAKRKTRRLLGKYRHAVIWALRFRRQRDQKITDLSQRMIQCQQDSLNWMLQAAVLAAEVEHRQEKLETMHQDLKEETRARASQAVHLEFQERYAKSLRQLVQEVRLALAREKSSRAREKLWFEFLMKVGRLAHGDLAPR
jgi:hypothetical protein